MLVIPNVDPLRLCKNNFLSFFIYYFLMSLFSFHFFLFPFLLFSITSSPMLLYCFCCCSLEFVFIANCNFAQEMFNDSYCSIQVHCISFWICTNSYLYLKLSFSLKLKSNWNKKPTANLTEFSLFCNLIKVNFFVFNI